MPNIKGTEVKSKEELDAMALKYLKDGYTDIIPADSPSSFEVGYVVYGKRGEEDKYISYKYKSFTKEEKAKDIDGLEFYNKFKTGKYQKCDFPRELKFGLSIIEDGVLKVYKTKVGEIRRSLTAEQAKELMDEDNVNKSNTMRIVETKLIQQKAKENK
jgi:hypothetical protein